MYHAASSALKEIDRIQERLLKACGMIEVDAFVNFNLAPLHTCRDSTMLGVIHRAVLRRAPSQFFYFFRGDTEKNATQRGLHNGGMVSSSRKLMATLIFSVALCLTLLRFMISCLKTSCCLAT